MGNIIYAIARILDNILTIYFYIIIASAIISWLRPDPYNPIVRFLRKLTEPVYIYIRRYIPFVQVGGFDLSPIVLIMVIEFVRFAIVSNLYDMASQMGVYVVR
jgi:YggT family protein